MPIAGDGAVVGVLVRLGRSPAASVPAPEISVGDEGVAVTWGGTLRLVPWPPTDTWPGDTIDQGVWQPWRTADAPSRREDPHR